MQMLNKAAPPMDAPMMTLVGLKCLVGDLASSACVMIVELPVRTDEDDDVTLPFEAEACTVAMRVLSIADVLVCAGMCPATDVSPELSAAVAAALSEPVGERV